MNIKTALDSNHPIIQSSNHPTSLTDLTWHIRHADERQAAAMAQRHDLPDLLARILAARGISLEEAAHFLTPSLKNALPDPSHLLDMDEAAGRVASAIIGGEKIAIFGDYDVDGATSSALLARYFRALGAEPIVYIPDRMKEGYGPNAAALLSLKERGAALAITVDCGTLAFEPLEKAHEAGLDVIVIDHHQGEAKKPRCYALVNPNRIDETSPHKQLAAVGVAFLLCIAVNRQLRKAGFFASRPEPDLRQYLDIVALGTVCDVVPLTGVNRALVAQGLKVMAGRENTGMRTLLDLAKIAEKPGVYHTGFVLGPRINAGGRVGKSDLGVRLLATDDEAEALSLAKELELHNAERKAIESTVLEAAMAQAHNIPAECPLLVIVGKNWHPGVIGIVAGRIKERFHKPTAVIAVENNIGKASARSVTGFDFGAAVIVAQAAGLLLAGGGHAMAAGFSVEEGKIPALAEFLAARAQLQSELLLAPRRLHLDGVISINGATPAFAELLERLGPFGSGNPAIRLALHHVMNINPAPVGDSHVKCWLADPLSKLRLSAIAFRCAGTKLGDALMGTRGKTVSMAGQLRCQEWMGNKRVSFMIEDIAC